MGQVLGPTEACKVFIKLVEPFLEKRDSRIKVFMFGEHGGDFRLPSCAIKLAKIEPTQTKTATMFSPKITATRTSKDDPNYLEDDVTSLLTCHFQLFVVSSTYGEALSISQMMRQIVTGNYSLFKEGGLHPFIFLQDIDLGMTVVSEGGTEYYSRRLDFCFNISETIISKSRKLTDVSIER